MNRHEKGRNITLSLLYSSRINSENIRKSILKCSIERIPIEGQNEDAMTNKI